MKRFFLAALIAAVCLGSSVGSAHALGIFATWWEENGTDDAGMGLGIRSKSQFTPFLSMDARVSWVNFDEDDINLFPIEATGMIKLGMLYAGLGGGYYIFDADPELDNNFGWYVLGGIDISVAQFGVFAEAKWTSLSTDIENVDPNLGDIPTDLEADGWGFNLGVMFNLPGM